MRFKRYLNEKVTQGFNVRNEKKNKYADWIVDGKKYYETRPSPSLNPHVGERLAVIRTGEGKAVAIGEVTIGKPIKVTTEEEFKKLQSKHLVPMDSKFSFSGVKYLYPMLKPVRYKNPVPVETEGRVFRRNVIVPFWELSEAIKFVDTSTGYQSGQTDMRLEARENGKLVGYLDYTIYGKEVSIKYIEGSKNKKGVGKQLILKLQSMFPKTEIQLGMLTDKGVKMVNQIKSKLYVDRKRINKLKRLKKELAKLQKIEQDHIKSGNWDDWDNDIYDKMYDYEETIARMEMGLE